MTPADEPTPTDEATEETTVEDTETESTDDEGVEAEATLLEKSQAAIDDAHEAVKKVAATDAIGDDAMGAGDLPAFADSTEDVEKPDPDNA
jgi:hypothetical protein